MFTTLLLILVQQNPIQGNAQPVRIAVPPAASTCPIAARCDARTPVQSLPGSADAIHVIAAPGSYYLTGNITGAAGKTGINITANDVSLDLNGFALIGQSTSRDGVLATGPVTNVVVRNGTVSGWGDDVGDDGIDLASASNTHVLTINASGNGGAGIKSGFNGVLDGCSASGNRGEGFATASDSTITRCAARANQGEGFSLGRGCTITACSAYQNGSSGFFAGAGWCTFGHSTAYENRSHGFSIGGNSRIDSSTAVENGSSGILALEGTTVDACTAGANRRGGINAFDGGCQMVNCEVFDNLAFGITAGGGSRVTQCSLKGNLGASIRAAFDCTISQNDCSGAGNVGTIGILIEGARSRVEANAIADMQVGLRVTAAGNLVIRNSAAGTTTAYDIVPGNTVGPIVDSSSIATSSNPHANYQY